MPFVPPQGRLFRGAEKGSGQVLGYCGGSGVGFRLVAGWFKVPVVRVLIWRA